MTDADVDGSHIRTLLLTFFFRQMRELIERGHVCIAQPPLYKISKGKQEQYLKDDDALTEFLTQAALEKSSLHVNADAPGISGEALQSLLQDYRLVMARIDRLSRSWPPLILREMIFLPALGRDDLLQESTVDAWCQSLSSVLREKANASTHYTVEYNRDPERSQFLPKVTVETHGVSSEFIFSNDFFASGEYRAITDLGQRLQGLLEDGAYIKRGERVLLVDDFEQVVNWLMKESRRGYSIQRYKGLGEMNPEQLWDTTMNPETRRMLRVTIEDAISADQMFNTLMGDQVEPRREFIETNALAVVNLDI